eukprot:6412502-Pyramimonas_sp.AAC.1
MFHVGLLPGPPSPPGSRRMASARASPCFATPPGSTGETFEGAKQRILKTRPHMSCLENVVAVTNQGPLDDDAVPSQSDSEFVKKVFEDHGFMCIDLVVNAREYGSASERKRWFCLVLDVPARHKEE